MSTNVCNNVISQPVFKTKILTISFTQCPVSVMFTFVIFAQLMLMCNVGRTGLENWWFIVQIFMTSCRSNWQRHSCRGVTLCKWFSTIQTRDSNNSQAKWHFDQLDFVITEFGMDLVGSILNSNYELYWQLAARSWVFSDICNELIMLTNLHRRRAGPTPSPMRLHLCLVQFETIDLLSTFLFTFTFLIL